MAARKGIQKPQLRNVAAILNREAPDADAKQTLAINQVCLSASQPRRYFDQDKLALLTQSIQAHGVLEPLLVRPLSADQYELIAGERRLRAAKAAGLSQVPVSILDIDDQEARQIALIENLQREDLNPVEEAEAILDLLALSLSLTRDQVTSLFYQAHNAKRRNLQLSQNVLAQLTVVTQLLAELGRFNLDSFRTTRLPLLKIPTDVLNTVRAGKLAYTKAQVIARVKDDAQRQALLAEAVQDQLSLSAIKAKIQALKAEPKLTQEPSLFNRFSDIGQRLKRSRAWEQDEKQKRLTQLLDELEQLID